MRDRLNMQALIGRLNLQPSLDVIANDCERRHLNACTAVDNPVCLDKVVARCKKAAQRTLPIGLRTQRGQGAVDVAALGRRSRLTSHRREDVVYLRGAMIAVPWICIDRTLVRLFGNTGNQVINGDHDGCQRNCTGQKAEQQARQKAR